jgi:sec-independent protein translocase protein TatC
LLITIFAAVITPSQDPLSMLLLAVPMVILYEAVIWISRLIFKK